MSNYRLPAICVLSLGLLATMPAAVHAQAADLLRDRAAAQRPHIMFIASTHLANHGRDLVNTSVPDVLEPQRQKEIEALVEAIARFKPTRVAVEVKLAEQGKLDEKYNAYRQGSYQLTRSETDQLGMRIAARLGHARIHAVDWNDMPPGPIAEYDFKTWAMNKGGGHQARFAAMANPGWVQQENAMMRNEPVTRWYLHFNQPEKLEKMNRAYFDYPMLNDGKDYPGANWVGAWYARNLKIFANLVTLADNAQDRVLVIYGLGHVFPLRQYAEQSGAFTVVDPLPLLRSAAGQ